MLRRAVAHEDYRRALLRELLVEALDENLRHHVAVLHRREVGLPELKLLEAVLAAYLRKAVYEARYIVVLLARDYVHRHDADVSEALVVHLRERLGGRRDYDVLLARQLPADDVRRIGDAHLGLGERGLRGIDEVVYRLLRLRHRRAERGYQYAALVLLRLRLGSERRPRYNDGDQ